MNIHKPNPAGRSINKYSPTAVKMDPGSFSLSRKILPDRGTLDTFEIPVWAFTCNCDTSLRSRTKYERVSYWLTDGKPAKNNVSRARHGRKTSQHEDENGGFGSVVPTQTKRYLHEFSTDLDETKNHSWLARRRVRLVYQVGRDC